MAVQSGDGTKMPQIPLKVGSRSEHCTEAGDKRHCQVVPPCSRARGLREACPSHQRRGTEAEAGRLLAWGKSVQKVEEKTI